jgi:translocation and assembly module TamB
MIKRIIHFILILLGIVIIALSVLTSTKPGLALLIKSIPGVSSVKHVDGSLLRGWHIQGLSYEGKSMRISVDDIQFKWRPRRLLTKTLMISLLKIKDVTINKQAPQMQNNQAQTFNTSYHLPINIAVPDIKIQDIQFTGAGNNNAIKLNSIHIGAEVINNTLNIHQLKINSPRFTSNSYASIKLSNIKDIEAHNQTYITQAEHGKIPIITSIVGNGKTIKWTLSSNKQFNFKFSGSLSSDFDHLDNARLNAQWQLSATDLEEKIHETHGSISSSGTISGTLSKPTVQGKVAANDFSLSHLYTKSLQAAFDVSPKSDNVISADINAKDIFYDEHGVKSVALSAAGNAQKHTIKLDIQGSHNETLETTLEAGYTNNQWQGKLAALNVNVYPDMRWKLSQASNFILSASDNKLDETCLTYENSKVCASLEKNNQMLDTLVSLTDIDLALLNSRLNDRSKLAGHLDGKASISYNQENQHMQLQANAALDNAFYDYSQNNKQHHLAINHATFSSKLGEQGFNNNLLLFVNDNEELKANFSMPNYQGHGLPDGDEVIAGQLTTYIDNLDLLTAFTNDLDDPKGVVKGALTISGTKAKPKINGEVNLINASTTVVPLGIKIKPVNFTVKAGNSTITYAGKIKQKKQQLLINGTTALSYPLFPTILTIKSESFTLSNTAEYYLPASLDTRIKIEGKDINVSGKVDLNKARIHPTDFSSTLTLPDDVIFVNSSGIPVDNETTIWNVTLNLLLKGKDLNFQYTGLSADLQGSLKLKSTPTTPLQGNGSLKVIEGHYRAYGQDLSISPGGVINFNNDLANPQVNLEATRTIRAASATSFGGTQQDLIVGIRVSRTLDNPKITLFSNPAVLNQQDIISYLVFGFPQSELTNSESAAVWQAVMALDNSGDNSVSNLKNSFQKTFGLSEIGFSNTAEYNPETETVESGTAFVIGKRIAKNLTLTYSMGIMIPINILYLRYRMSQHWSVQTDSSALGNGADIMYSIQRD